MNNRTKNALIVSIISILVVTIGVTYAYFGARITGLESASTLALSGGKMAINYAEGNESISAQHIYPREEEWITKTFTLTGWNNTGQQMPYEVGLDVTTNTFPNNYLTADLTLVSGSQGTPIATTTNIPINGTGMIALGHGKYTNANGDAHSYELKIYFKDNGENQNDAQRAVLNAKLYVNDGIEGPTGWNNPVSGSLVEGLRLIQKIPHEDNESGMTTPGRAISINSEGMRSTPDDYGLSFYYRGEVENNYVSFAGMCWRIVRIVGDGSIKLTLYNYNPTGAANPCDASLDGDRMAFARTVANNPDSHTTAYNTSKNSQTYIGFMYSNNPSSNDFNVLHANDVDSEILTKLKTWYDLVFTAADKAKLADVIWCNDKRPFTDTTFNPNGLSPVTGTGVGTGATYYQGLRRLLTGKDTNHQPVITDASPSLKCGDSLSDNMLSKFTAADTTYGNGDLNGYKIGLLTADEIAFAGEAQGQDTTTYLDKNATIAATASWYWTMTPSHGNSNQIYVLMHNGGLISRGITDSTRSIRPAVALRSDVTISSGNGTQASPFVVN